MADEAAAYSVKIPVFEGPLDLLLHLLKQNKIDIYDIPISLITRQYLEYIGLMKELNLEIASEFLVMAATLIYIKSRMLLPPDETIEAEETEDPRAGLVQRLLEYQAVKEASVHLRDREEHWGNAFARPPEEADEPSFEPELCLFEVNLFDLLGALKKVLSRMPPEAVTITRDALKVKDKIALILERMEQEAAVRFEALFEMERAKLHIIVTFLALLEILKLGLVRARQIDEFGSIWIMRREELVEKSPASQGGAL